MSGLLIATLIAAAGGETIVYRCRNAADEASFALTFERRGRRLRDVTIGHYGLPRLGEDVRTRWRGEMTGADALFTLRSDRPHTRFSAEMRLAPDPQREGAFRLTWTSTLVGGHVQLQEQERSATCTRVEFEQASPAS